MGQLEIKDQQAPYHFSMRHRRDAENPDDVVLTFGVRIPGGATVTPRKSKRPHAKPDAPRANLKSDSTTTTTTAAPKKKKERSEEQKRKDAERRKARREQQKAEKQAKMALAVAAAAETEAKMPDAPMSPRPFDEGNTPGLGLDVDEDFS